MNDNIEQSIKDAIREKLIKEADLLVDIKIKQIQKELWDSAQKEINNIMNSILVTSFNDVATMKTEIMVTLSGLLKK